MSQLHLSHKILESLEPSGKPYFVRDTTLRGLGVKVTPAGSIKYVVEVWNNRSSTRRTIGQYPFMSIQEARKQALIVISDIKSGADLNKRKEVALSTLFKEYTSTSRIKPRTVTDYEEAINYYLRDWLKKPVSSISKSMVEKRFYEIRDKGINGGKPTYSQATKTMRILSALMNYARADDLIDINPVEVLKLKRVDRSIRKREHYLKASEARELLKITENDNHPGVLAIHLMLYTGLRKNEALMIKWKDIQEMEGLPVIMVNNTKNNRPHAIPITPRIQEILNRAMNKSAYVFPSTQKKGAHIGDIRASLVHLSKLIGVAFKCHDLRRTFATRAMEIGIDYLMIKRLLNHKTNDITAQYIQWNSRKNLEVMREALEQVEY